MDINDTQRGFLKLQYFVLQVVSQTGDRSDSNGQRCLDTTTNDGSETDCQTVNISILWA